MASVTRKTERSSFARIRTVRDYPDFLDVQLKSFGEFVQDDTPPEERIPFGLQSVFEEIGRAHV